MKLKGVNEIKFNIGDNTDKALVRTIAHEFSRCKFAFESFIELSSGNNKSLDFKLKRYNSYSLFITHLYEFLVACFERDKNVYDEHIKTDKSINLEVERIQDNIKDLIDKEKAPEWVNDREYYEDKIPSNFGEDYRGIRNNFAHADPRRNSKLEESERLTLNKFYRKYHKYVIMLYFDHKQRWEISEMKELDMEDIIEFNKTI